MHASRCLSAVLLGLSAVSCSAPVVQAPGARTVALAPVPQQLTNLSTRLLAAHNQERAAAGVPPLQWDPALAASAAGYGPALAASGRLDHAPEAVRQGQGENLWEGTRGVFSLESMVADWASERRWFRPGTFPNVSTTGNWADVGHYTQIIWPGTTHVGCAVHQGPRSDFLICRYSPAGNVQGQRVP